MLPVSDKKNFQPTSSRDVAFPRIAASRFAGQIDTVTCTSVGIKGIDGTLIGMPIVRNFRSGAYRIGRNYFRKIQKIPCLQKFIAFDKEASEEDRMFYLAHAVTGVFNHVPDGPGKAPAQELCERFPRYATTDPDSVDYAMLHRGMAFMHWMDKSSETNFDLMFVAIALEIGHELKNHIVTDFKIQRFAELWEIRASEKTNTWNWVEFSNVFFR